MCALTLAGAPVTYAGHPVSEERGSMDLAFRAQLDAAFADLWDVSGLGVAAEIQTGGIRGDERSGPRHRQGRAFDLNGVVWPGQPPLIARRAPEDARRYLATEAILRRHCGQVLGYWYDVAHRGHWHVDDRDARGWRQGQRSTVVFAQAALTLVLGQPLTIDGKAGPRTLAALRAVGYPDKLSWDGLLGHVAGVGFGGSLAGSGR